MNIRGFLGLCLVFSLATFPVNFPSQETVDLRSPALSQNTSHEITGLPLQVDDAQARYPLTVDLFYQTGKLLPGSGYRLGESAALSADGNTALVGAPGDFPGSVYVFVRSGTTWIQETLLTALDGENNQQFGEMMALSADGNTALIGAPGGAGTSYSQGSAYVFTRSGTSWSQQAKLVASDGAYDDFLGSSVALSADGNTALIGAERDDIGANSNQGSVYVFVRSGSSWSEQGKLTASDGGAYDWFGASAALSADGNTALVGARYDVIGSNVNQGSAYIFVRSGGTWGQLAKLVASDGAAEDSFGYAAALSADGNTALLGAYLDDIGSSYNQGSAYVFIRSGGTWSQQAKLVAADGSYRFGLTLALGADGNTALINARYSAVGANVDQGSAYVFVRSGTSWSQQVKLLAPDGAEGDFFGASVALSADGNTALIGAPGDDIGNDEDQGSAHAFTRSGTAWSHQAKWSADLELGQDGFGWSVALSGDGDTALVGEIGAENHQGSGFVFERSTVLWVEQADLIAFEGEGETGDRFGWSAGISADGSQILFGAPEDDVSGNAGQGSAYCFTRDGSGWSYSTPGDHLLASDGSADDHFGWSLTLSTDGSTALVGAPEDDLAANTDQGSAYVFIPAWSQQAKLLAADGAAGDRFGMSTTLSADGNTALVGAPEDDRGANSGQGSAYIFVRADTSWGQQFQLLASDGAAGDRFGASVALSADGNTALVGARFDDVTGGQDRGSSYVFIRTGTVWTQQVQLLASDGAADDQFGMSVALSADGNTALVGAPGDDSTRGSAYIFTRDGVSWTQQAKLLALGGAAYDAFGRSVSLSADGNTFLVGARYDNVGGDLERGAAYLFEWISTLLFLPLVMK